MVLNPLQKRRIYDDYVADVPSNSAFDGWCEQIAVKYETSAHAVRNVVVTYRELEDLTLRAATVSESQKLAALAGATRSEAYKTLARGMKAFHKRVITNREGHVVEVVHEPDHATQVRAAVETLKANGAYEETLRIKQDDPTNLSNEQLAAEIANLSKQITGPAPGAEGQESGTGPAVLPDAMHPDQG